MNRSESIEPHVTSPPPRTPKSATAQPNLAVRVGEPASAPPSSGFPSSPSSSASSAGALEPRARAGLRLQLVLALGALAILAFVPLFLAVANLTRHALVSNRAEVARSLGRAVAGRLAADVSAGRDDAALRDVALVSLDVEGSADDAQSSEGVVAVRVASLDAAHGVNAPIEVGSAQTLATMRSLQPEARPGELTRDGYVEGIGPILDVEVVTSSPGGLRVVQVALRVGDQAARAAPLLKLVAFYTAGFAVILIVFAYLLLTRLIVRPIGQLVRATRRIEAGTSRRLDPATFDAGAAEVAELGGAIARSTARLVEREETLAAKVRQLETAKADLLAARDAIVRSERLASVGRLAAGLAHEVGNPIAALLGLEEVLLTGELDADTRDLVVRMKRETERVHRVMRDLLDFARAEQEPTSAEPHATASVREVVDEVVALVAPQRSMRDIELDVEIDASLPAVRLSPGRLQQVLLNLVLNAADAIGEARLPAQQADTSGPWPAAGAIGGRTAEQGSDFIGTITIRARELDRNCVRIEVLDDGPGVPARIRDALFEPFVTTKEIGKGTGLGLAVCRGLIEGAGGAISLQSEDASGAIGAHFVIDVPTPDAPPPLRSVAPPKVAARIAKANEDLE